MTKLEPEKKILRRWLSRLGRPMLDKLLLLQQADTSSKGRDVTAELRQFETLHQILAEIDAENACLSLKDLAVKGSDLMALGYNGKDIGIMLHKLLDLILDEKLPNDRDTLLAWVANS